MSQVVAELLQEALGIKVYVRRYAPPGYTWQQHVADATKPHSSLHRLLAQGGSPAWDFIIFQAGVLRILPCIALSWELPCVQKAHCMYLQVLAMCEKR